MAGHAATEALLGHDSQLYPDEDKSTTSKKKTPSLSTIDITPSDAVFNIADWQWEFAAIFVSSACIATVVAVLARFQDEPLARWSFMLNISLNTVVAALVTLSRTALLVPVASCMCQLKWIHLLGTTRPLRNVQVFEDASRGPWGSLELIWRLNLKSKLASWGSLITVLTLVMGPFAQQILSYPSRLVYLPGAVIYASRDYEMVTADATDVFWKNFGQSERERFEYRLDSRIQAAAIAGLYNLDVPAAFSCPSGNCRWNEYTTLAINSTCRNVTGSTQKECDSNNMCNHTTLSGFRYQDKGLEGPSMYTLAREHAFVNASIMDLAILKKYPWEKGQSGPQRSEVTECNVRWCARVITNASVNNGTFHPGTFTDFDLLWTANASLTPDVEWLVYDVASTAHFPDNKTYAMPVNTRSVIQLYLKQLLYLDYKYANFFRPAFFNSKDLSRTIDDITNSLTYALSLGTGAVPVQGEVMFTETYISVTWMWITIPLVQVFMGMAFLVCTLVHTHRKGVIAWKSSALVPMLTSMEGWDARELQAAPERVLEKRAETMYGCLVSDPSRAQVFKRVDKLD